MSLMTINDRLKENRENIKKYKAEDEEIKRLRAEREKVKNENH